MDETNDKWVIITDEGFQAEDGMVFADGLSDLEQDGSRRCVYLKNHTDAGAIEPFLGRLDLIAIDFPSYADGRGMSLATELKRLGFAKTLQARGHVIPDQYAQMRRCGFDQVAIPAAQAKRQPQAHWLEQVAAINDTYQVRLEQAAKVA
ncbi:MAG: DUF934 domain-containing protein [Pseudomonadota bacterium]